LATTTELDEIEQPIDDLIAFGKQYDFEVEQISVQEINEISVSSTKIRNALLEGDMTLSNEYSGYAYFLTGTVIQGKQLEEPSISQRQT
jgi:riboflavin kinase/FMN adenylyltransferase